MTYFLLPRCGNFLQNNIICEVSSDMPATKISPSLSNYLYDIKHKLTTYEKEWDVYKKYTNPYEYIHTVVPHNKKSVSNYKPLSRSFFKMIELIHIFHLCPQLKQPALAPPPGFAPIPPPLLPIKTFHLAEGPGGFIEAIAFVRNCKQDQYVGITLMEDKNDPNIPSWKKSDSFLRNNKNVAIECGADGTGNILSWDNFLYCKEKYGASMDIITADGGFDFSSDFNKQEVIITRLLFGQICYAIALQKPGGSFVLKIFDCFYGHTIDLLYILSSYYEKVYISKPQTSRHANSEKYVVCKGFFAKTTANMESAFSKMLSHPTENVHIWRFLNVPVPHYFVNKLEDMNSIIGQQQLENIHYTLSLIDYKNKYDKIDALIRTNVQKCIHWCLKYHIKFNPFHVEIFNERELVSQHSFVVE
jgi:23S rRNA U2552 (ribose-2'-O)-methylase RlmE/FtsJ